ncbi:hypothetical protein F2P56_015863 [Juglans regia]|uniref:Reverse transcriptase Ty1/copia-type domain-containing protein n=1 Tax=Juglans regia TaxID=51240 RepID=A0A833XGG2_JUGRE|nr:hypothetical protein F2P56_015863 [Juglans regia]
MFHLFLAIYCPFVSFVMIIMCFFEFHSNFFLVKDSCSRENLLRGLVEDGLYALPIASQPSLHKSPQALIGTRTSPQLWHSWLGHPSFCTTTLMLRRFNLPLSSKNSLHPCSACSQSKTHPPSIAKGPLSSQHTFTPSPIYFSSLNESGPPSSHSPQPILTSGVPSSISSPSSGPASHNPHPMPDPTSTSRDSSPSSSSSSTSSAASSIQQLPSASSLPITEVPHHHMITRSKSQIHCPKIRLDGTIPWPPSNLSSSLTETKTFPPIPEEPSSFSEASKHHEWRLAMHSEITALLHYQTWDLVPPSPSYNLLGSKWILKSKRRADGSLERRKARLVAQGFHQQHGLDYTETFSLVVKPVTIRLLLSLAISSNWPLHQLDIQNAFLHGDLDEDVYMKQPPGFVHSDLPSYVCKLKKSIYGLKQAPRAWFAKLSDKLLSLGFRCSASDSSLFILRTASTSIFILVYVDDIIVTGSCSKLIYEFVQSLGSYFPVKDLGPLHFFFGIEVTCNTKGLFLSQCKYINDLLHHTNMNNCKSVTTPMSTSEKLSAFDGCAFEDPHWYRSVVGSL